MDLQEAINMLKTSPDANYRRRSAEILASASIYDEGIVEALIFGLSDGDRGVKDICSRSLAGLPDELAYGASVLVAPLVTDPNIEIRNLASDILLRMGNVAQDAILPFLQHPDEQVRQFSCDIVGKIGDEKALPYLKSLLSDSATNCRISGIDAIGNLKLSAAVDSLIKIYGKEEDLMPFIIEAIGKISGPKAQTFLMNLIKTETDMFVQSASIDALALGGDDLSICYYLFDELPTAPVQMQTIILKTIYAIAYRLEQNLNLPIRLRYIAQKALFDDDENIRGAGLVALGDYYDISDIPGLMNEILARNTDSQHLIIYNLLLNSSERTVSEFFKELLEMPDADGDVITFISFMPEIVEFAKPENLKVAIDIIIDIMLAKSSHYLTEVVNVLINSDRYYTISKLRQYLYGNDLPKIEDILDLIMELSLEEFSVDLTSLDFEDDRVNIHVKQVLSSISEVW